MNGDDKIGVKNGSRHIAQTIPCESTYGVRRKESQVKVRRQSRLHSHLGRAKPAENMRFASYRELVSISEIRRFGGVNSLKIGLKRRSYGLFRWSQGQFQTE